MVIQFRDRKQELETLVKIIRSDRFEFIILYGRRRIGKTELILHATHGEKRIYYLATGENNLNRFYNVCLSHFPEASKLKIEWEVLFDFLINHVDIIIIDEFQNLIGEDKNILSIFQSIIDQKLKSTKIKLFLLGSSVSIITSKVLSYQSPLYGRRTGSMKIKKIAFGDLKEFFPKLNFEQIIDIYGFAGGIPYYLVRIDNEFWPWLKKEIGYEATFLRDEIDFLMRYEFSDVGTYKLILEAIANGKTKINEIKDHIRVSRTDISPYIKNLIEVDLIKREVPITENVKSRFGRYFLADNFLKFWFKFIYPNLSSIEEGTFKADSIKTDYASYLGYIFEDICKDLVIKDYPKVGRWWHKENEIDIVALNDGKKEILFAECKWSDSEVDVGLYNSLKDKAKLVDWNTGKRIEKFALFSKSGFTSKMAKLAKKEKVMLYDLKKIEKMIKKR